jgi:hexosaminidase
MKRSILLLVLLVVLGLNLHANYDLIPKPKQIEKTNQEFILNKNTKIVYKQTELKEQAALLKQALTPSTAFSLKIEQSNTTPSNTISLAIDNSIENEEAYKLEVLTDKVLIKAKTAKGVFYATQTLLQLAPREIYNTHYQENKRWAFSGVKISDTPEFKWRGIMLDVSRYFMQKDYVLHYIDMMATYKLNILHLHLIDDAGWRIEIKKYPKLTSVGGFRGKNENRSGGYYTQEEIKEIVEYARVRGVEVIPEIELPAHVLAGIAAYPHLSCQGKEQEVQVQHTISKTIYCIGKESTFTFLEDVLKEVFELFPTKYIHIGGDEARYDEYKKCPHCQKRMKEEGLKHERELQVYLNQRIQKFLTKHNKFLVGWDEIIEPGLTNKVVGMIWHNKKKTFSATKAGHDVVMALTSAMYFDIFYSKIPGEVKSAGWLPPISLKKVYDMQVVMEGLEDKYKKQVLGPHACLWTDQFIHGQKLPEIELLNENRSEKYCDYLTNPRLAALGEVAWVAHNEKNWYSFYNRMKTHYNLYDNAEYGYRVPVPVLVSKTEKNGGYEISMDCPVNGAEIRFSTNGDRANAFDAIYTKPVWVKNLADFSAVTVVGRKQFSLPLYFPGKFDKFKRYGKVVKEWNPNIIKGKTYSELEIKLGSNINSNGNYELSFWFTGGAYRLDIKSIAIYKSGKLFKEINQFGYTGGSHNNNIYKFKIDNFETGSDYSIKAQVRGDVGNDSKGAIFIKKK